MMKFSVLMSVYIKEKPDYLAMALNSVVDQTYPPDEIVLVKDGPITPQLERAISEFDQKHPQLLNLISLTENKGLGHALKVGLEHCSHELVARMDTDDMSRPQRFQKQIEFMSAHPEVDVLGANIEEFHTMPGDLNRFKISPEYHDDIVNAIYLRNPFNHPSIMMRKTAVLQAGSYREDLLLFEDYALFLTLWKKGARFYNIQDTLLDFRVGDGVETIKRRSGLHYLKKENAFLAYARSINAFNASQIFKYKLLKFPIRLLSPKIVLLIYNTFFRK